MKFQKSNLQASGAHFASGESPPSRPWAQGGELSGRNLSGFGAGSLGERPEDDPFSLPLDGERQAVAPMPAPALPAVISTGLQVSGPAQTNAISLNESLMQCPFCLSVFRSGVAGRLGLCPVCAAVSQSTEGSEAVASATPAKEPLARLNRTGTMPARKLHRNSKRVTKVGKWGSRGHFADSSQSRRWGRLALLVAAVLLVCGIITAMARPAHSKEPLSVRPPAAD